MTNEKTLVALVAPPAAEAGRNRRIPPRQIALGGIMSEFDALYEGETIFDVCGSSYVWQDGEVTPKYAPRD